MTIEQLRKQMTPEQKAKADAAYKKFYLDRFGDIPPVMCVADDDGIDYLQYVDTKDFE